MDLKFPFGSMGGTECKCDFVCFFLEKMKEKHDTYIHSQNKKGKNKIGFAPNIRCARRIHKLRNY